MFNVYLKQASLPELIREDIKGGMLLTSQTPLDLPFPMPVPISINGKVEMVGLSTQGTTLLFDKNSHVLIDPNMRILCQLPLIGGCEENLEKRKNR